MAKLVEYDQYKAPWEKEGAELDPERAKRFIYTLLQQNETLTGQVATVTAERDKLNTKVTEAERGQETEIQRLERELAEAKQNPVKDPETERERLQLSVALEKGLTRAQAKRLLGSTEEEMAADADDLLASFGGSGKSDDGGDSAPKRTPRPVRNPADPDANAGDDVTWESAQDKVRSRNSISF